jgi:AcrR family transcriptional regulator
MEETNTREKFLEAGKKEFLEKGFKDASLRQISKKLGFTLGAFYGCFKSKEDLFESIVSEPAGELFDYYVECHKNYFADGPDIQRKRLGKASGEALNDMIDYMYEHYDEFKLLFCKSAGTKYESYLEKFISVEVDSTKQFLNLMKENMFFSVEIDDQLSHNLSSMLFKGIIEVFEHDMSYEHAKSYIHKLHMFYTAGWMRLFEE